ncbi:hypothetical protein FQN54_000247 [Arachnomyces sp. PD_36]|nr:hypothetical protein FQN54_000247 [Arachnomyces sp. PD_36]
MTKPAPKLPWQQLTILAVCRFAEPVVLTSVFPYLPEMMESLGSPKNDIAKWVGLSSAAYSICQCIMGIPWGIASDYLGRKPVLLNGLLCTMLATLMFGFSRSLGMAVAARALTGLGNGNVGILRTAVAEMVPERELQPRAFSVMPLIWTLGSIFGPIFGGSLANPVVNHPETFGDSAFLKMFPFALPNIIGSCFFVVGLITGFLFLEETLASKKDRRDPGIALGKILTGPCSGQRRKKASHSKLGSDETTALLGDDSAAPKKPATAHTRPLWRDVLTPQSCIITFSYAALAMHSIAFDAILPVFLNRPYEEVENNPKIELPFKFVSGFDIQSQRIGLLYTITGIIGMLIQFLIFPPVTRRYGSLACFKLSALSYPFLYAIIPFTVLIPTDLARQIVVFAIMMIKLIAVIFSFPSCTILLTNSASSLSVLGTLNGIATSVSAIGRGIGPAVVGWAFSRGVEAGYMIVPWWVLAILAVAGAVPIFWIVETDGFHGNSAKEEGDGEGEEVGGDVDGGEICRYGSTEAAMQDPLSGSKAAAMASVRETDSPTVSSPSGSTHSN